MEPHEEFNQLVTSTPQGHWRDRLESLTHSLIDRCEREAAAPQDGGSKLASYALAIHYFGDILLRGKP